MFRGRKLSSNLEEAVSSIEIDLSVDQVSEIRIELDDPGFAILKSGVVELDTPVSYRGLKMSVAVVETTPGGGEGGLSITCRSDVIRKLKKRQGPLVMQNASPSDFVARECKAVGAKAVVEESKTKKKVARDVKEKGQKYDIASKPSSWTTFRRLADEVGFLMFEIGGTVYFGRPTWLVKKLPKVQVKWYPTWAEEPYSIPSIRESADSEDTEVSLQLPLGRAGEVLPGRGLSLGGFPRYSGNYIITSVNYPLAGPGVIEVSASTVRNPEPQKAGDEE